ncbi:MAG: DUF6804 family protein [Thermotogota bacterium]|nr:DUF6804 family protein [Thermotogota bacterium]
MKRNPLFLIAGIALFIAILNLPYGYYQLLRFFICGVGVYGAYLSYRKKNIAWVWILGIIALVFNPILKFYFVKETWKIIDLIAGVLFCVYFGIKK